MELKGSEPFSTFNQLYLKKGALIPSPFFGKVSTKPGRFRVIFLGYEVIRIADICRRCCCE